MKLWNTVALGKKSGDYKLMLFSGYYMPLVLLLFPWYILFYNAGNLIRPIWIDIFVWSMVLVFLHMELEIIRFLRVARKTAKQITISTDKNTQLTLFSNKKVLLDGFTLSNDADKYTKSTVHKRLFPKGSNNLSVTSGDQTYFISSTMDDFEGLKTILQRLVFEK